MSNTLSYLYEPRVFNGPIFCARPFATLSSFVYRVKVAAAEALFAKERPAYGATSGPSNVTGDVGLEYQPVVMGGDKGNNLPQPKGDAPDLESHETDHINNREVTTSTDEHCDGYRKATKHQQQEAGVRQQGGVLSTPNVKMVLFLSCVTQVRWDQGL